jgi:DNA replication protein DnaC
MEDVKYAESGVREVLERVMMNIQRAEEERWDALPAEARQHAEEERRRKEAQEEREARIAAYTARGVPPRYYDATWENWVVETPDQQKAIAAVKQAWVTNLFLCGSAGTGKTHLAMCLAKEGGTYKRLPDIFREVRANFSAEQGIINRYGTVKLLIIDEVGRQNYSPFEMNLFFEIIDKRWNTMVPTTLISNMKEREFLAEYGKAVLDRLRPVIVRFDWASRR